MKSGQTFLIALGGNLPSCTGAPDDTLRAAVQRLRANGVRDLRVSRFYRTPCFPAGAGPDYVNAAARMRYDGGPEMVLRLLHDVEAEFGRARRQRWGQRVLDLDLLAAGDDVLPDRPTYHSWHDLTLERQMEEAPEQLILPHPRLHDRAFVLVPLSEVAPHWVHPVTGRTVLEMLEELPVDARREVVPID